MNMFANLENKFNTKKKEMFDFNLLCELYKTDISKGREYLYENMQVFMRYSGFNIIYDMDDTINDSYLVIDKWILESLEKGFAEGQIYNFIKFRLKGYLINKENRKDKMTFFQSYSEEFVDSIFGEDIDSLTIEAVKSYVMDMSEPKRTVLLMKLLSDKPYTLDKIAKIIGITVNEATKIYKEGIRQLRYILYDLM